MLRIYNVLFFLIIFFSINQSFSQSPDILVKEYMDEGKVPGVFVAVVKNDSVLFQKGYGVSNMEKNTLITNKTCMEFGSVSKAFTDEAILYLQYQHLLNIDDPITKYLTDAPASWSIITIRNLMDHTSGIKEYLLDPRFMVNAVFDPSKFNDTANFFLNKISTDSLVHMFYSLPITFSPNATWSYSNTGYILLGKIAEKVSGKKFFDLVNEVLFAPLSMLQTKANEVAFKEGCLSQGYYLTDKGEMKAAPVLTTNYAFSAGAWATTGNDLIKYMKAIHLHKLPSDKEGYDMRNYKPGKQLLPFNYNLAHFYSIIHGKHIISHVGGTPGFTSSWIYVKEDTLSIIVLANRQEYTPTDQLAWNILEDYDPSLDFPNNTLHSEEETKYTALIIKLIDAIQHNKAFHEGLSKPFEMFMDNVVDRGLWQEIFERGYPTKVYCVDKEMIGKTKAYRFRLSADSKTAYKMTAIINDKNELAQLLWW